MEINEHIKQLLRQIPEEPGVYQYFDKEGTVIYVGKAKNLHRRVSSYFQKEHEWLKTRQLVRHIADIRYVVVPSEQDAFLLENNLIKQYQPHYNILLKDGKSYPSICIRKEAYPRIFKTRKIEKKTGEYFGPYSYGNTVDLVLELIHKLCPIRTCQMPITQNGVDKGKYKVCLKYHLHNCCGICEQKISKEQYDEYIDIAKKIIRGDARLLTRQLQERMYALSEMMKYEEAGIVKSQLELLEKFCSKTVITNSINGDLDVFGYTEEGENIYVAILHVHNGSIVQGQTIAFHRQLQETKEELLAIAMHQLREQLGSNTKEVIVPFIPDLIDENLQVNIAISGDRKRLLDLAMKNVMQYREDCLRQADKLNPDQRSMRILSKLQELLGLKNIPVFIDSFDNSHIQGSDAVAGCVVFRKGRPSKSDYKRFKIQSVVGPDDYADMREIVRRRYTDLLGENKPLPDLIIADGGEGQMNAIKEVLERQLHINIPVAGLKKDDKHHTNVLLYGTPPQEFGMKVTDELFRLLVQIQDEVHRFAISYHKQKRSKSQTHSELDDIQGVGEVSKQKLLRHFHSVSRAKTADLEELRQVLGNSLGTKVYEHFRRDLSL
ncbi:MAG: excinuclease ABC subunit C [Paludibacteraceae bacterium]|nr:excinuclease ABC subunit C [Paludibacteraceae bacterium]